MRRVFDDFPRTQDVLRRGEGGVGRPLADDVVWDASEMTLPDLGDGIMHGHDGVRRFWMSWLEAWDNVTFEYELHEGKDKVVVLIHQWNQGTEITMPPMDYAQVWTFSPDGLVVHWKLYNDQQEALRQAGIE